MSFSECHISFGYIECSAYVVCSVVSITAVVGCEVVIAYFRSYNVKYGLMVFINAYWSVIAAVDYKIDSSGCIIWKCNCNCFIISIYYVRTVFFHLGSVLTYFKFTSNGDCIIVVISAVDYSNIVSWVYSRLDNNIF